MNVVILSIIKQFVNTQGDPKQTQIFQTDCTSTKMNFWAKFGKFCHFGYICYIIKLKLIY